MSARRRLSLSPAAVADLEDIAAFIARDNPGRAATFIAELEGKCRAVAPAPEALRPLRPRAWRAYGGAWTLSGVVP